MNPKEKVLKAIFQGSPRPLPREVGEEAYLQVEMEKAQSEIQDSFKLSEKEYADYQDSLTALIEKYGEEYRFLVEPFRGLFGKE